MGSAVMEKEYVVTLKSADDATQFHTEMTQSAGEGVIPNRTVDVANLQPGSLRNTTYALSDEEAAALTNDPRVEGVEIPFPLNPNLHDELLIAASGDFNKTASATDDTNYALYRCSYQLNPYTASGGLPNVGDGNYHYHLDGTGVDVVILDSSIEASHPEWEDANGVSRLQQIDWYDEAGLSNEPRPSDWANRYSCTNAHGTLVASLALGRHFGFAKNAQFYFMPYSSTTRGPGHYGTYNTYNLIRLWHNNKPIQANGYRRPTIVNMSFIFFSTLSVSDLPNSITYRGTTYTGTDIDTLAKCEAFGYVAQSGGGPGGSNVKYNARVTSIEADITDMIAAGIHVVGGSGNTNANSPMLSVAPGDPDYDNSFFFQPAVPGYPNTTLTHYYHRGASPAATPGAICVGGVSNIEDGKEFGWAGMSSYRGNLARIWNTTGSNGYHTGSCLGSRIDLFAPAEAVVGASGPNTTDIGHSPYFYDAQYKQRKTNGTSLAAPLVTGVAALAAQLNPHMTPAQMREYITTKCVSENQIVNWGETGPVYSSTDYANRVALNGSPNKFLFNPFGTVETYKVGS